jgi:thiosulfate/3-mercaptopyruvate sulfurtransferase
LIDVRQSWTSYLQSHLLDATWLHVESLRAADAGLPFQLLSGSQYAALLSRLGLTPGTPVVVYSAGDQADIDATFAVWLLASAGIRDVRLLDGGFAKWELEGRPVSQRYPRAAAGGGFDPNAFRPAVAMLEDVVRAAEGSGALLVDARPPEQYEGTAGAQARRGHIPGAVNHPWKDDLEKPEFSLVWKSPARLRQEYASAGITPDRDIILYCNSGTEASHVYFALRYLLGYPRVRVYTGSWTQWAERGELPVETVRRPGR